MYWYSGQLILFFGIVQSYLTINYYCNNYINCIFFSFRHMKCVNYIRWYIFEAFLVLFFVSFFLLAIWLFYSGYRFKRVVGLKFGWVTLVHVSCTRTCLQCMRYFSNSKLYRLQRLCYGNQILAVIFKTLISQLTGMDGWRLRRLKVGGRNTWRLDLRGTLLSLLVYNC